MSNVETLIQKMKQQPNGIRFNEAKRVLESRGYEMKKAKRNIT